jgi:hypothetical protein
LLRSSNSFLQQKKKKEEKKKRIFKKKARALYLTSPSLSLHPFQVPPQPQKRNLVGWPEYGASQIKKRNRVQGLC